MNWNIEPSDVGRIVVPPSLPERFALFYTTVDFDGRLDGGAADRLTAIVRDRFGIDASLSTCTQVHGKRVVGVRRAADGGQEFVANDAAARRPPQAARWSECDSCDALWTSAPNTALGIKVADCLPVTIFDPANRTLANIHSGWRGAAQRITAETLGAMTPFDASAAHAWLGPTIRACCFEVGEEVVEQLRAAYENADRFVDRSKAKPHVDVAGLTAALLVSRGFAPERVHDSGLCTRCDGSIFHSYRRNGKGGGRNLAIAAQ